MSYQTAPFLMQSLATPPCTESEEILTLATRSCQREDGGQSIVVVVDIGRSEAKSPASGIIVVEGGAYVILLNGHEA